MRTNSGTKLLVILTVAALAVQTVRAQRARIATDPFPAAATLDAAADALGMTRGPQRVDALSFVEYWGAGTMHAMGQAFRPDTAWPAFKVSYHASIGYVVPGMRVDVTRTNPDGPVQGGGGLPLAAPQRQIQVVSGKFAWNESTPGAGFAPGTTATPAPAAVNDRLLQMWITPHGVVKAARQAGAAARVTFEGGATVITLPAAGTTVKATLNAKNLIERVETRADNPVVGDIVTETTYSDYKDLNGKDFASDVLFPAHIVQKQGGFPVLDLTITKTDTNNPYVIFPVPENVEKAVADAPVKVETRKVADGVWYLTGGTHHSVAVEFKDHVVLIEAPQNDARALAVIDTVKKTIPNKPIRYVVNTHHHFDHSGGLRAAVAEGARIITQAANKPYYEKVWAMPHTLNPDRLAKSPRKPVVETVDEKRVLSDGTRSLELFRLQGSDHADTMLVAYLPKEKILVEADVYTPAAANAPAGAIVKETVNLYDNIQRLKLDVQQIASIHGRLVTINDLRAAAGKISSN